jgi:radical SAM superfamily enzyme YgiQ (UPF0313 family)
MPLGLSFLASSLRTGGHQVEIFDRSCLWHSRGLSREAIDGMMLERLRRFRPDIVGFNTVSPLIYDTVHCVALIRPLTNAILAAGGHHTTAFPELTLQKIPGLDLTFAGEGEQSLLLIADGKSREEVPGIAFNAGDGRTRFNMPKQIEDLDGLPFPALDLLDMRFYLRRGTQTIRGHYLSTISLITSRVCTRRCDFCAESLTYGKGIRYHSPGYVIELIERLTREYSFDAVYFHDNNFLSNVERAALIFEEFIRRGISARIKWAVQTRADSLQQDILPLMKKAGCVLIEIGIEASAQETLSRFHKGTTVNMNEKAIALCRKAGIAVHAYMLTSVPGETMADLDERLQWIKKARPSTFSWHSLKMYPGTRLYLQSGNRFFESIPWSEKEVSAFYNEDHFSRLTLEERRRWTGRRFQPFSKWWGRRALLRSNSPSKLFRLLLERIIGRVRKKLYLLGAGLRLGDDP